MDEDLKITFLSSYSVQGKSSQLLSHVTGITFICNLGQSHLQNYKSLKNLFFKH